MFEDTLLDSSVARTPTLGRIHRVIALGAGALGFLVAFFGLPIVLAPAGIRVLIAQSVIAGAGCMLYALMLCYVHADARRLGLRAWLWSGVTLLFNLAGFLAYLVYSAAKTGDWRRAALPLAYTVEIGLVSALVLVPLISTQGLPKTFLRGVLEPPLPPPGPPAGHVTVRTPAKHQLIEREIVSMPVKIPHNITRIVEAPELTPQSAEEVFGSVPGGVPNGYQGGVPNGAGVGETPPPPPLPATRPRQPTKMHVGGVVEAAKLIFGPKPAYPPLAIMARVQGAVRLEAVIARDGTVEHLKVLEGHPLLVNAATDAVSRWRYQPTLLNGEPVEVETEVVVNFILGE